MGLSLRLSYELELEVVTDDSWATIFPMAEKIMRSTEGQKALRHCAGRKDMDKYRSMMDFLFAESFGNSEKKDVFRYYDDKGPPCRKLYSNARIAWYDSCLVGVMLKALEQMRAERAASWAAARAGKKMVLSPMPE